MFPRVSSTRFLLGATKIANLLHSSLAEVAILGRSNVGKSTFINRLTGMRRLARTSSTPGRTREINLFEVKLSVSKSKTIKIALADLPGFGFAKVSKSERESLAKLCVDYLTDRQALKAILLLNDVRRDPEEDEFAVQELAHDHERRLIVVLTKADKLKRGELISQRRRIAASYGLEAEDVLISGEKIEVVEVWSRLLAVL